MNNGKAHGASIPLQKYRYGGQMEHSEIRSNTLSAFSVPSLPAGRQVCLCGEYACNHSLGIISEIPKS